MRSTCMVLLYFFQPQNVHATPGDGIIENETLIGYNSTYYYSIKTVRYPTGSYYKFADSTFVMERALATGKVNTRICTHASTYIDQSTEGDWTKTEYRNTEFNYPRFLLNKKVKYLYPERYLNIHEPAIRLDILKEGLVLQLKDYKVMVMDLVDMEPYAPWITESLSKEQYYRYKYPKEKFNFVTIKAFVNDDQHAFFIIESKIGAEILQAILVMEGSQFKLLQKGRK
ncbi:hypothetical protein LVD17_19555 [Fulvivirga ulvae]|uniref:hypothetical protein n=1 Tax=Fulvivirga ulvae TaxID=2904245 RepID=UPI001F3B4FAD|nr:hypothetical protein [Fulvivirga ulvae]UII30491.1 hypothetical protein LVD17_19555 [Fulvivirga ulvae]